MSSPILIAQLDGTVVFATGNIHGAFTYHVYFHLADGPWVIGVIPAELGEDTEERPEQDQPASLNKFPFAGLSQRDFSKLP